MEAIYIGNIWVVGLGIEKDHLTRGAMDVFLRGIPILLRTGRCEAAAYLQTEGIAFETLDFIYERAEDFDELNEAITQTILARAASGDLIYGVLDLRDESVSALLKLREDLRLIPGVPVEGALAAFARGAYACVAACDCENFEPEASMGTLVRELDSRELAAEVKLRLMERYPEEQSVVLLLPSGETRKTPLCALDRLSGYDHRLSVFVPPETELQRLERYGFSELNRIMRILRGPNGCPWDRAQTHESIRQNVLEEAWEVAETIKNGDTDALYDELGDLLLQVTLHAEIARQHGEFSIDDVTSAVCQKLISRHVHIFGDVKADTPEEVLRIWEDVKKKEKHVKSKADAMRAVTAGLPALMRAEKVVKKAGEDGQRLLPKESGDLGDRLLVLVAQAVLSGVQPELALTDAVSRLIGRFSEEITQDN